jgi:flagellar basal-body rod protein FlgF
MPGSHYIALSGLRARADSLDRLATDIANIGTAGYKGERHARAAAERPVFNDALQTAIDTTYGGRGLDATAGAIASTGRALDVAVEGDGFFVLQTAAGERYTRNGHFTVDKDRRLVTDTGALVRGVDGPITLGDDGEVRVDPDGSIWTGTTKAGQLAIVEFANPRALTRDHASQLRADGQTAIAVAAPAVRGGSLEQSNVSVADRLAELTSVSRGFEALQKSLSLLMNDVDGRAIEHLGRR